MTFLSIIFTNKTEDVYCFVYIPTGISVFWRYWGNPICSSFYTYYMYKKVNVNDNVRRDVLILTKPRNKE